MSVAVLGREGGTGSFLPKWRWLTSEHPLPWLLPAAALMTIFGIYPLLYALWLSLHKRNPVTRLNVFDPDHNWGKALADPRVWDAVGTTLLYTGIALVIQLVLGLLIALLLDTDRKGYGVLRALMTLPLVVPPAVTGMMFLLMLDGSFGVLSRSLYAVGLLSPQYPDPGHKFDGARGRAPCRHLAMDALHGADHAGGPRSLPKEPFEAAAIDGATAIQAFFRLTLPMMSKVIAIAVLIRGIDLFRVFDYVKVMTDSGPGTATETLTSYAGRIYFNGDFPYASTLSLITLLLVIVASTLFMKIFRVKL